MPYWIRDSERRLVKIKNPHETKLELCVKVMEATPEDLPFKINDTTSVMHVNQNIT